MQGESLVAATNNTTFGHAQVLDWIRQWGNSTSEAINEPKCHLFCAPGIEGVIGFRMEKGRAVVLGDPVCDPKNTKKLAMAFHEYCDKNDLIVIYLLVTKSFASWAIDNICNVMVEVCDEVVFNPQHDPLQGSKGRRLRNKVNHAQSLDLRVSEYISHNPKLESDMMKVGEKWLKDRKGFQIYLGNFKLFDIRQDRRWFYVKDKEENIIAVAMLRRLDLNKGWFIKFMVTSPDAPRGTSEFLMTSIFKTLGGENCHYISVGAVPGDKLGEIRGLGSFSKFFVRSVFSVSKWLFHLDQRKFYFQQFNPINEPTYILFSKGRAGINDIRALMNVLNVNV